MEDLNRFEFDFNIGDNVSMECTMYDDVKFDTRGVVIDRDIRYSQDFKANIGILKVEWETGYVNWIPEDDCVKINK